VTFVECPNQCHMSDEDEEIVCWLIDASRAFIRSRFGDCDRLDITLCLMDGQPKILPERPSDFFDSVHVNSGLSIIERGQRHASVLVYRREEYLKVLLHELIHCHGADMHMMDFDVEHPEIDAYISKQLRLHTKRRGQGFRLSEAYVDLVAILLYAAYASVLLLLLEDDGVDPPVEEFRRRIATTNRLEKQVEKEVEQQVDHVVRVGARVCKRLLLSTTTTTTATTESTHAFAYYVAKSAMMYDLSRTLEALPAHGIRTDADAWQYLKAVTRALASPSFWRGIVEMTAEDHDDDASLRMSAPALRGTRWAWLDVETAHKRA
jgi:hypothetical protein